MKAAAGVNVAVVAEFVAAVVVALLGHLAGLDVFYTQVSRFFFLKSDQFSI